MEDILIVKDAATYATDGSGHSITTIGGTYDISDLEDGGLLAFDDSGAVIDKLAPVISGDSITFALGRTNEGTKLGMQMDIASLSYDKTVYVAPVAKKMCIGYDGTNEGLGDLDDDFFASKIAEGDMVGVMVTNDEESYEKNRDYQHLYFVTVTAAEEALTNPGATVLGRLVTLINDDTTWNDDEDGNNIVTASIVSTDMGLRFTGRTGKKFHVVGYGELEDATYSESTSSTGAAGYVNGKYYSASTSPTLASILVTGATFNTTNNVMLVLGKGTSTEVAEYERRAQIVDGHTDTHSLIQTWDVTNRTVSGETYTIYSFLSNSPSDARRVTAQPVKRIFRLAIPSTYANMITWVDNIIGALGI